MARRLAQAPFCNRKCERERRLRNRRSREEKFRGAAQRHNFSCALVSSAADRALASRSVLIDCSNCFKYAEEKTSM